MLDTVSPVSIGGNDFPAVCRSIQTFFPSHPMPLGPVPRASARITCRVTGQITCSVRVSGAAPPARYDRPIPLPCLPTGPKPVP